MKKTFSVLTAALTILGGTNLSSVFASSNKDDSLKQIQRAMEKLSMDDKQTTMNPADNLAEQIQRDMEKLSMDDEQTAMLDLPSYNPELMQKIDQFAKKYSDDAFSLHRLELAFNITDEYVLSFLTNPNLDIIDLSRGLSDYYLSKGKKEYWPEQFDVLGPIRNFIKHFNNTFENFIESGYNAAEIKAIILEKAQQIHDEIIGTKVNRVIENLKRYRWFEPYYLNAALSITDKDVLKCMVSFNSPQYLQNILSPNLYHTEEFKNVMEELRSYFKNGKISKDEPLAYAISENWVAEPLKISIILYKLCEEIPELNTETLKQIKQKCIDRKILS